MGGVICSVFFVNNIAAKLSSYRRFRDSTGFSKVSSAGAKAFPLRSDPIVVKRSLISSIGFVP